MLEALTASMGIVSTACKAVGIGRTTHYRWIKEDEEYSSAVESINEATVDFAESALYKLIQKGDTAATIFYLKTKGKNRGYLQTAHLHTTADPPIFDLNPLDAADDSDTKDSGGGE